ncbi:MAG: rhomboid family intramembrane serine protease [Alphaproteobacteria bacterium]|nr:rhomboid family intramembrane serine protease [Alphaproteobacteria bacterium]MCB9791855.1 rhomboid family intramembrane serine protease [Alphaproteobacteria bacterium]
MSSIRIQGRDGVEELPLEEFERRVRLGELAPETLVSLEVVTGRRFVPLGDLELYQTLADPEAASFRARFSDAPPLLTALLVGIQIRVYLWSKLPEAEPFIIERLTNSAPAALELGEVWRLLSYGFMHLSFTHLALNMLFLAYAGTNLERAMGWRNLLSIWLVSVLSGGLLSMLMSPGRPSLGASGGDFGLIAAAVVLGWKFEDRLPESSRIAFGWAMLPYLIYPLFRGLSSTTVDNWGHLGGLIGGGVMATWLQPDAFRRFRAANQRVRQLSYAAAGLTLAFISVWGYRLVPLQSDEVAGLELVVPAGWREGWTFTDDWGWLSANEAERAAFVATTRIYKEPITPADAQSFFIDQLDARVQSIRIRERGGVEIGGWPATRITLEFDVADRPQVMEALLVTRGAREYRVYLNADRAHRWRYGRLAERLFAEIRMHEPPELTAARARAQRDQRAWRPALELAVAASQAGYPEEALSAFERAYRYGKGERVEIAAAMLDFFGDYPSSGDPLRVQRLLDLHPEAWALRPLAARALRRMGELAEAERLITPSLLEPPPYGFSVEALGPEAPDDTGERLTP